MGCFVPRLSTALLTALRGAARCLPMDRHVETQTSGTSYGAGESFSDLFCGDSVYSKYWKYYINYEKHGYGPRGQTSTFYN